MTMTTRWMTKLAVAAAVAVPAVAAHAEKMPTVVVMHRNIQNVEDEANWQTLAGGLSFEGFRVISIAFDQAQTAKQTHDELTRMLAQEAVDQKVLLVGTSAVSETIASVAAEKPTQVEGLVFVSASDAVPAFGPRTVNVPAGLASLVPTYQVKITRDKSSSAKIEGTATILRVREEGKSTLARNEDLIDAIKIANRAAQKTVQVGGSALATK